MKYKFVAIKYGRDKLRELRLKDSPIELADLNNMLDSYISKHWRIKQFFIQYTDDPVFVVLLERPERSDNLSKEGYERQKDERQKDYATTNILTK
jgi:hypothetical protein